MGRHSSGGAAGELGTGAATRDAPRDRAVGVRQHMADIRIQHVEALPGYRLRLTLSDGRTVERDVAHLVPKTDDPKNVFTPLGEPRQSGYPLSCWWFPSGPMRPAHAP